MAKITVEMKESAKKQLEELRATVRYDTRDYPVELIVEKFGKGDFEIPDYQRSFIWDDKDRSFFVESVLLGLPIPFMFWAELEEGKMEIVDGVQRINTLSHFMNDKIKLRDLKKLDNLNGFKFSDLGTAQQLKFKNRALRIVLLSSETAENLRQDIFSRVNRSGKTATPSEFRRGTYPGKLTDYIDKCQNKPVFREICPLSKKKELRYEGFELVLRFFAYANTYLDSKHEIALFLDEFLKNNQETFNEKIYENEFVGMCNFVKKHFPSGFAKPGIKQVPRVRFEAISVGVVLALRENPSISLNSVDDWLNSNRFEELTTTDASNNPNRLKDRIEFVRDCILGKINNYDEWRK
jgi:hypothetical protein